MPSDQGQEGAENLGSKERLCCGKLAEAQHSTDGTEPLNKPANFQNVRHSSYAETRGCNLYRPEQAWIAHRGGGEVSRDWYLIERWLPSSAVAERVSQVFITTTIFIPRQPAELVAKLGICAWWYYMCLNTAQRAGPAFVAVHRRCMPLKCSRLGNVYSLRKNVLMPKRHEDTRNPHVFR